MAERTMYDPNEEAARQERIRVATEKENATLTPEQKEQRRKMGENFRQRAQNEAAVDPIVEGEQREINGLLNESPTPAPEPSTQQPTQAATPAPASTPNLPTEPTAAPGDQSQTTIGTDGKGRTTFGSYVRVVDQKTGEVSWEDTNGNPVEAPKSQQMMEKMDQGLRPRGDLSWDDALKQQSFENVGKAQQYARNAIEANRLAIENRRKGKAKQNAKVADEMGSAFANLQDNLGYVAQHVAGGGSIEDSGAYRSKDGNYYVRGIVAVERLGEFNKEMAELGGKDSMERIVVSQQVSKTTGKPIGEPTFAALYRKNGIDGRGDGVYAKKLNLAQAVNYARMSQVALGKMSDQEAKEYAVWAFGGKNPLNWNVKKPDAIDPKMAIESGKLGVEQDKQRLEWAKFNASQNQSAAWNKDQHEAMVKELDRLMFTTTKEPNEFGELIEKKMPREMSPDEQKQAEFLRGQIMRGFGYNPPAPMQPQRTAQEPDKDITLPDGRAGRVHNGKTYVQDGKDASGNLRWMPVEAQATTATQGGGAASSPASDMAQPVGKLGEQPQQPQYSDEDRAAAIAKLRERGVNFDGGKANPPAAGTEKPNPGTQKQNLGTEKPNPGTQAPKKGTVPKRTSADIRRDMTARRNARTSFTDRYKTVQDVARDVVKTLNDDGQLSSIVNPDGTRRKELTPQEKDIIIHNVHQKFVDAGMSDFWDREVEEYTQKNRGGRLTKDAIIDKLFRDWNNKEAPLKYGNKK